MITKNFKALLAMVLEGGGNNYSSKTVLPVKATNGETRYIGTKFDQFPNNISVDIKISSSASDNGIWLGSGNTPESETDYILDNRITSGLTAPTPTIANGLDASGNPYIVFTFLLTNTTSTDIIIKEIGYVQVISSATTQGSTSYNTNSKFLLDRTVLDTPITVEANGNAAIKYTLKTILPT